MATRKASKTKTERVKRTPETEAARAREREQMRIVRQKAMLDHGVRTVDVQRALEARGTIVTHQTVSYVIGGRFRSESVERVFCELTNTKRDEMFPPSNLKL